MNQYLKIDAQSWEYLKNEGQNRVKSLKPWTDFFDRSRFSKPASFQQFSERLHFNMSYFENNYILLLLIVIAYFLITNLWLLFSVLFLIGGYKWLGSLPANQPFKIGSAMFNVTHLWLVYGVVAFILLFFTGVTGTVLWIGGICCGLLALHAGFIDKPVASEFEEEP